MENLALEEAKQWSLKSFHSWLECVRKSMVWFVTMYIVDQTHTFIVVVTVLTKSTGMLQNAETS